METSVDSVRENTERELSRQIGYRLLSWSLVTLWAVAVIILFRIFDQYPPAIDRWLLWTSPLLIFRSVGGAVVYKQIRADINIPSLAVLERTSLLFGICDGVLLLTAAVTFVSSGALPESALIFIVMTALALMSLVYMFTPRVTIVVMALVIVPVVALGFYRGSKLPLGLILSGICILAGTVLGVHRFVSLYLRQLQSKFHYQNEMHQAAESNFIFNEQWQRMQIAAIDWDRDCIIKSWNPAAERLFGIPAQQAVGRSLELLFDGDTAAAIRSGWMKVTDGRPCAPVVRNHQSSAAHLSCWYDTPLFHEGEFIGMASFVIDLAEPALGGKVLPPVLEALAPRTHPAQSVSVPVTKPFPVPQMAGDSEKWAGAKGR